LRLREEEGATESQTNFEKTEQDRLVLLKEGICIIFAYQVAICLTNLSVANVGGIHNFFNKLLEEDHDLNSFKILPLISETLEEYPSRETFMHQFII
jgi:hypothetical protein